MWRWNRIAVFAPVLWHFHAVALELRNLWGSVDAFPLFAGSLTAMVPNVPMQDPWSNQTTDWRQSEEPEDLDSVLESYSTGRPCCR